MADDEVREENVADIDFSQIRTSIQLGGRMIEQILNSVHYGSAEVRCLLLDECDLILECRVCRGLFRALPNFVAHKRVYCKQAYIMTQQNLFDTLPDEDVVVIQPTAPEDTSSITTENSFHSDKTVTKSADERLKDTICQISEGSLGKSEMYKLYSKAAEKIDRQKKSKKTLDVVLSKIASNPNAVRVSYHEHHEADEETPHGSSPAHYEIPPQPAETNSTHTEKTDCSENVSEPLQDTFDHKSKFPLPLMSFDLNPMSDTFQLNRKVELEDTAKGISASQKSLQKREKKGNGDKKTNATAELKLREKDTDEDFKPDSILDMSSLKCLQCNTKYSSRKTLLYHLQMRHSGLRTFFPCPYCSNVFFYFWGLTRHLRVNHKKTPNQINKMRKILREAAFTKNVTKPCVHARDQLEFTTELKSKASEIPLSRSLSDTEIDTENASKKRGSSVIQTRWRKKVNADDGRKVCSKATVKHTSKQTNHSFARRYVPAAEEIEVTSSDNCKTQSLEGRVEKAKKYNHQLSCDICKKVFWKQSRLRNHKKFCSSSRNVTSSFNDLTPEFKCSVCGKIFLRKSHLKGHLEACTKKERIEKKSPETKSLKSENVVNEDKVTLEQSGLFRCLNCKRTFEKKISLENHKRSCQKYAGAQCEMSRKDVAKQTDSDKSLVNQDKIKLRRKPRRSIDCRIEDVEDCADEKARNSSLKFRKEVSEEDDLHVVEEIWIHKQPGRPSEKVKSNRIYVMEADSAGRLHCQDTKKLSAMVDETDLKCKKCGQEFTSVSNLRRHAIRHLGWKRYKCKLCRFSSYNKSECNTHIVRTHSEKYRFTSAESLIVDLNKEASRIRSQKKLQTLSARQVAVKTSEIEGPGAASKAKRNRHGRTLEKDKKTFESEKLKSLDPSRKFNISTRNSPRKFDTRPYQKFDSMTTLFTRKGYYPKPSPQCGVSLISNSSIYGIDESLKKNDPVVDPSEFPMEDENFASDFKERKSLSKTVSVKKESTHKQFLDKQNAKDRTDSVDQLTTALSPGYSSSNETTCSTTKHDEKVGSGDGQIRETIKGRKRPKSDDTGAPMKQVRTEKTVENPVPQQSKKQSAGLDAKSTDFLAPWPRASEPMSVKEMFALIRRSPRAGCGGVGRRKSLGDAPIDQAVETFQEAEGKPGGRRSVGAIARSSPRSLEGRAKLGATLARRSSPAGNTLSLSLRTCRPGVDWSQNTDRQTSKSKTVSDSSRAKDSVEDSVMKRS